MLVFDDVPELDRYRIKVNSVEAKAVLLRSEQFGDGRFLFIR